MKVREGFKRCCQCKEIKTREEFHRCHSRRDGCYPWCKMCRQGYGKAYYEKRSEKILANQKEQRKQKKATHPDRRKRNDIRVRAEKAVEAHHTWTNRRISETYQISYPVVLRVRDDLERAEVVPVLDFLESSPGVWQTNRRKWSLK